MAEVQLISHVSWRGIDIQVGFIENWPIQGFCHIEIKCDEKLPLTETGYKSHIMLLSMLEGFEDHVVFVVAWLDDVAKSKEWKQHIEQSRQGNLFDLSKPRHIVSGFYSSQRQRAPSTPSLTYYRHLI